MPNTPRMTPERMIAIRQLGASIQAIRNAGIERYLGDSAEADDLRYTRSCLVDALAELDAVTRERDEALYIPGTWICPTCGFVQEMLEMSATNGAVRPSTEPALPCPNDGEFMHRLTWSQHAKSLMAYIDAHA